LAISDYSPSLVAMAFGNGLQYRTSDLSRFICDDLATSCKHLVNVGPVTPECKRVKCVHPFVDQQFGYVRLAASMLDSAGISTQFSGAITRPTQVLFHLHARWRHCYDARATR